ncbi:MAG TPA: response regulator [Thermodesulfobacteriota bacterium]|nr:response regulator [Thermodesulfobacteriota bacterium]
MKVLIVDDDELLGALIRAMIEKDGAYKVTTARDGEEGYLAYLHFRPNIIITDIEMPRKNGLEMVKAIRAHDPEVKIIYMSGDVERLLSLRKKEKNEYPARFLKKPFSRFELTRLLSEDRENYLPDYCYEETYHPEINKPCYLTQYYRILSKIAHLMGRKMWR